MLQVLSEANHVFFGCHLKLTYDILSALPRVLHCKFYALCHVKLEKNFCSTLSCLQICHPNERHLTGRCSEFPRPSLQQSQVGISLEAFYIFLEHGEPGGRVHMSCGYSHVWLPRAAAFPLFLTNMHKEGCVLRLRSISIIVPCPISLLVVWQLTSSKWRGWWEKKKIFLTVRQIWMGTCMCVVPLRPPCWRVGQREGWGRPHPLASFLSLRAALIRGTEADMVPGGPLISYFLLSSHPTVGMQRLFSCCLSPSVPVCFCSTLINVSMCLHAAHLHRAWIKGSVSCCKSKAILGWKRDSNMITSPSSPSVWHHRIYILHVSLGVACTVTVGLHWGIVRPLVCSQAMRSHDHSQSSRCSVVTAYLMSRTGMIIFLFCFSLSLHELLPGTVSIPPPPLMWWRLGLRWQVMTLANLIVEGNNEVLPSWQYSTRMELVTALLPSFSFHRFSSAADWKWARHRDWPRWCLIKMTRVRVRFLTSKILELNTEASFIHLQPPGLFCSFTCSLNLHIILLSFKHDPQIYFVYTVTF